MNGLFDELARVAGSVCRTFFVLCSFGLTNVLLVVRSQALKINTCVLPICSTYPGHFGTQSRTLRRQTLSESVWRRGLYVAPQGRLRLAYIDYEAPDFVRRVRSAMHGKLRAQNEDAQKI